MNNARTTYTFFRKHSHLFSLAYAYLAQQWKDPSFLRFCSLLPPSSSSSSSYYYSYSYFLLFIFFKSRIVLSINNLMSNGQERSKFSFKRFLVSSEKERTKGEKSINHNNTKESGTTQQTLQNNRYKCNQTLKTIGNGPKD